MSGLTTAKMRARTVGSMRARGCSVDFETALTKAIIYHYAKELARAYQAQDGDKVQEIKAHITNNYGREALVHIAELAVLLVMREG